MKHESMKSKQKAEGSPAVTDVSDIKPNDYKCRHQLAIDLYESQPPDFIYPDSVIPALKQLNHGGVDAWIESLYSEVTCLWYNEWLDETKKAIVDPAFAEHLSSVIEPAQSILSSISIGSLGGFMSPKKSIIEKVSQQYPDVGPEAIERFFESLSALRTNQTALLKSAKDLEDELATLDDLGSVDLTDSERGHIDSARAMAAELRDVDELSKRLGGLAPLIEASTKKKAGRTKEPYSSIYYKHSRALWKILLKDQKKKGPAVEILYEIVIANKWPTEIEGLDRIDRRSGKRLSPAQIFIKKFREFDRVNNRDGSNYENLRVKICGAMSDS